MLRYKSMIAKNIIEELEKRYPTTAAESWDNPGLLVGEDTREVQKVYVVLDVTKETLKEAVEWGADMIISHHPMLFSSIKKINNREFTGQKILELIQHHITYYAMHTNFDVCKMAEINARLLQLQEQRILSVTRQIGEVEEGIGRIGQLPHAMTLEACANYVKEAYHLPGVKVFGELTQLLTCAAVSGGSGKSMVVPALLGEAEVLITGDIDHHTGIDAVDQGLCIIDAGHYGTEYFFMEQVKEDLLAMQGNLKVKCAEMKLPYVYV